MCGGGGGGGRRGGGLVDGGRLVDLRMKIMGKREGEKTDHKTRFLWSCGHVFGMLERY